MTSALTNEYIGRKRQQEIQGRLDEVFASENLGMPNAAFLTLVESISKGTVALEELDSILARPDQITSRQTEWLLWKKAQLLWDEGRESESFAHVDEALKIRPESLSIWAWKATALVQLERLDEAFQCFQKAYSCRDNFGENKQGWVEVLFTSWSETSLLRGLLGIYHQRPQEAEKGVNEYLAVLDKGVAEGFQSALVTGFRESAEEPWSDQLWQAVEELELMIRLLAIKDPFEGWRALGKELSKVWPERVSAVDAIREQRE